MQHHWRLQLSKILYDQLILNICSNINLGTVSIIFHWFPALTPFLVLASRWTLSSKTSYYDRVSANIHSNADIATHNKKTRKPLIPNPSWITRYCETNVEIHPSYFLWRAECQQITQMQQTELCVRKITHTIWIDDHVMLVQGCTGRHESQKDFYGVLSSRHR
jgi:hypothetical protein